MRAEVVRMGGKHRDVIHVTLSRRNLLSLLHKLDVEGSARTLFKDIDPLTRLVVTSEDDTTHYAGTTPGPMHPDTEAWIEEAQR